MATLDETYISMEIQQDLVRILPNIHDLIAQWRAQILAGQTGIGPNMTAAARGLLGRLRRLAEFATEESAAFDAAIAPLAVTRAHLNNRVVALRDVLRTFRDAAKTTGAECTAALNTLEAAIPAQRRFLNRALPSDW